jgi:glucokinase
MLLAGDIGGTKTNLAIYSSDDDPRTPRVEHTYPSARYASLDDMVREFLGTYNHPVTHACFGIAGPVVDAKVITTNLPWHIDAAAMRAALNMRSVLLLNDLAAIANAVPILKDDDLLTLNAGVSRNGGAMAVIAPGTGLGEAYLTWNGTHYTAHESEGGHADFAPTSALQVELLHYLQERFDHVSCERVCSGIGIPNIYAFLKDVQHATEPPALAAMLANSRDHTPIIVNAALEAADANDICARTLDLFVRILGSEAGNLALKVLATGGIYLGGGIPPRITTLIAGDGFLASFRGKGRFSDLLSQVPIHIIRNPKAALIGAAAHGMAAMAG